MSEDSGSRGTGKGPRENSSHNSNYQGREVIPIIISKCDSGDGSGGAGSAGHIMSHSPTLEVHSENLVPISLGGSPSELDHQLTIGLIDGKDEDEGGSCSNQLRTWNAFALSDPNVQLTVKSITSIGLGSTDGRNLYVRRVPSSASILINNNIPLRRETDDNDCSDATSSVFSTETRVRLRRKHWRNKLEFVLACIGFTVGLGNVWRFPYLCYKSGGGAFLIVYFIMLFVCGFPLLYMELAIGQFTRRGPVGALEKICPLLKGTGIASLIISFILSTYSIVIIAWTLYFLVASFNSDLPWQGCGNEWNTENCLDPFNITQQESLANNTAISNNLTISTQEYFDRKVLQRTGGLDTPGYLRGELVLCLFFAWVLVYFSLWKSVRSSGKVVFFTATFPYVLLIAFISFAVTLPGADSGLRYFFKPRWEHLLDGKVWVNAAAQNFNSIGIAMGSIVTFSSYNRFSNNILTDTLAIGFINAITSVLVGITVFAMLGNIALQQHTTVDGVVADGPGLIFVVYPQALVKMPFPHLWSVLFFSMLLCVALDNEFAMVEVVVTSIRDGFPKFTEKYLKCHELLVLLICVVSFLLGLPNVLQGGIFIFQLIDQYAAAYSLMFLAFFEVIAVIWVYGAERLGRNIQEMTGRKPSAYFINCWRYAAPLLIIAVWALSFIKYEKPSYDNGKIKYPLWAEYVGWTISSVTLLCIPVFAFFQLRKAPDGTLLEKIKSSLKSTIEECPTCKYTRNCTHEIDGDSEWNLNRRRSSIKTTKITPVIMSEAVYEKVSSL